MTDGNNRTVAGTDIEEVKRLNQNSGLSYNEAKELLAKQMEATAQTSTAQQTQKK
ncbi:hypothetical protein [Ornithinibacillus caprae]|uniref:hypothetical protein n=1 Tax=Ornithinibacillus caprae TaxID=2678566 RepID=UPI0018C7EA4F|nr:hypothetical protein [Ornithinibacillus caprae]